MKENNSPKSLKEIIQSRRTIRSFTPETPPIEDVKEIIQSAMFAPYGGTTGILVNEIRKIFVFSQHTEPLAKAREMLRSQLAKKARKMNMLLILLQFLRKKMQPFSNKLNSLSKNGIPSLHEAAHFIIVVEKKRVPPGYPPIEKQSIAHAMQNMWLTATNLGLGFQLVTETGILSQNAQFLKLLGLSRGNYVMDGCVIGLPNKFPEIRKEISLDGYATWM